VKVSKSSPQIILKIAVRRQPLGRDDGVARAPLLLGSDNLAGSPKPRAKWPCIALEYKYSRGRWRQHSKINMPRLP